MKKYLGVKIISAEPAVRTEGNISNDGYTVMYEDGYKSWSPKDVFEKAYKEVEDFDFLKQLDIYPNGDWQFSSCDNYQGDCCSDEQDCN